MYPTGLRLWSFPFLPLHIYTAERKVPKKIIGNSKYVVCARHNFIFVACAVSAIGKKLPRGFDLQPMKVAAVIRTLWAVIGSGLNFWPTSRRGGCWVRIFIPQLHRLQKQRYCSRRRHRLADTTYYKSAPSPRRSDPLFRYVLSVSEHIAC